MKFKMLHSLKYFPVSETNYLQKVYQNLNRTRNPFFTKRNRRSCCRIRRRHTARQTRRLLPRRLLPRRRNRSSFGQMRSSNPCLTSQPEVHKFS